VEISAIVFSVQNIRQLPKACAYAGPALQKKGLLWYLG